jgi:hypothetical protein
MKLISKIADIDGKIQELVHESKLPALNKLLDESNDLYIERIAELEKERDVAVIAFDNCVTVELYTELRIDPLLINLLNCCDGLSTEYAQSNYGGANEWVRHIDAAYTKYVDSVDSGASERFLQAHNLDQQAKGLKDFSITYNEMATNTDLLVNLLNYCANVLLGKAKALKEQGK